MMRRTETRLTAGNAGGHGVPHHLRGARFKTGIPDRGHAVRHIPGQPAGSLYPYRAINGGGRADGQAGGRRSHRRYGALPD